MSAKSKNGEKGSSYRKSSSIKVCTEARFESVMRATVTDGF